tara:strand:+ start:4755 stop:6056 length:1302 start_codon:yes stop_codon:yes gene_type:complete
LNQFKDTVKSFLKSLGIWSFYISFNEYQRNRSLSKTQRAQLRRIKSAGQVKVFFLVIHDTIWKYDSLFRLLQEDSRFLPYIVVIPFVRNGQPDMELYKKVVKFFGDKNYPRLSVYNRDNNEWLDLQATYQPDIVFFTNPHRLTFEKYYSQIYNSDVLTCYVPYAFVVIHSLRIHYAQEIHRRLWKYFVETKTHGKYATSFLGKFNNRVVVTGYPALDTIFDSSYSPKDVWKVKDRKSVKRIIWAPHHSIEGQGSKLDYSCFTLYADWFIKQLRNRSDIQIAFKPHPLLKEKLYKHPDWGKMRTDSYYRSWQNLPNGQLEESEYLDLFYYSDAMVMDSASFMVEYLYFHKPIMFLVHDELVSERFNSFGREVFSHLYHGRNSNDISDFIDDIVISGNDSLKNQREHFFFNEVLPKGEKTASERIYHELKNVLCP